MSVFPIGDQRVGVERQTVTGYGDYNIPITEAVIVWVDNACFEIQTPSEQQNMTVTTSEIAWAMLPVADGTVPAVDDNGDDASFPFFVDADSPAAPFFIDNPDENGKPTISSGAWLWHNGLRYAMRGDAVLEQDIRGRQDHVFAVCEREQG